jgi:hypothetical protein
MKKAMIVLILIAMIFCGGCWTNSYVHKTFDPNTGKLISLVQFDYAKAMVSSNVSEVSIILPDGAYLKAKKVNLVYDGNDWEHIGNAVATGRTGGLNKIIK